MRKMLILFAFALATVITIVLYHTTPDKSTLGHFEFDAQNITAEKIAIKAGLNQAGESELKVLAETTKEFAFPPELNAETRYL